MLLWGDEPRLSRTRQGTDEKRSYKKERELGNKIKI
jgi:hypothetical protein